MSHPYFVVQGDAQDMPFSDGIADLIIFSPPYGLGLTYNDDVSDLVPDDWAKVMEEVAAECRRIAKPNCRLAINVPLDTSQRKTPEGHIIPPRPVYADAVWAFSWKWKYRCTIIWREGNISKSVARGSMDSANAPHIICRDEAIIIFHVGDWNLGRQGATMDREEWLEWTGGVFEVSGETHPWEKFPAAFPLEIPRRLIRLLSFPFAVVVDPFCGSGTTLLAALQENRNAVGLDLSAAYVDSARRRLKKHGF